MKKADIEKIESYNEKTKIDKKVRTRYEMCLSECVALLDLCSVDNWGGISLAYKFGMSRGYRAAKSEARR